MPNPPNDRLRALLAECDWNTAQLAAAVRAVADQHGQNLHCDRSTVSRWLSGTRPRPPAPTYLLEALSRRLSRPVTATQAGLTRLQGDPLPSRLRWDGDPLRMLTELTHLQLQTARWPSITADPLSLGSLSVPDYAELSDRRRPARPTSRMRGVGAAEIEAVRTMRRVFSASSATFGGAHARTALAAYLAHDVIRWVHSPSDGDVHRGLLSGTAQLTVLLGNMCADSGADALAQHHYRTAALLAAEARDTDTYAIAVRTLGTHTDRLGHVGAARRLAQQAADTARRAPSAIQAYVQAQLAVSEARCENPRQALAALRTAERLHSQTGTTDDPFTSYSLAGLHYQRAETLAALGDRSGALTALAYSLRQRAADERRARALTHARIAELLMQLGHLEEACSHWRALLDDHSGLRSSRSAQAVRVMRQYLRPHQHRAEVGRLLARGAAFGV
ncbi:hypothetical protein ACH429_03290 [Streptomyces pathocidini]|uniref:Transcriptional regulator n=1 Tax=Streptomyces pathocidini TaxID=1650571 RepID=A0ABW7UKG4_9ACTN|nr:hypothetical protein [Streptomyces pathocidini]